MPLTAATLVRPCPGEMSDLTYVGSGIYFRMAETRRPLVWLHGEVKTPPFSAAARLEAGLLLRRLQRGDKMGLPHVRPMPAIGTRCAELRIPDESVTWRIHDRVDPDAIVIAAVFAKRTQATPAAILVTAKARLRQYDRAINGDD